MILCVCVCGSGFSTDLMLQSVSQATLGGLLLSGVQSQAHAHTPSPPPGLAPIHKTVSAEHLNGHVRKPLLLLHTYTVKNIC